MHESLDHDVASRDVAGDLRASGEGTPSAEYCAYCGLGLEPARSPASRFGEPFCGEEHAEAFAAEVRASRTRSLAAANDGGPAGGEEERASGSVPASRWSLKRFLALGACCAAPILAAVLLAGGGAAVLGAGAAALPYLGLLACPLAMFFLMRAMHGHGDSGASGGSRLPAGAKDETRGR
jgi:hypothetical protein